MAAPVPVAYDLSGDLFRAAGPIDVDVKENWEDDWDPVAYLKPRTVTWSAAPTIPTAILHYRYGEGKRPADSFDYHAAQELVGQFVRITIQTGGFDGAGDPNERVWYGIISEEQRAPEGSRTTDPLPGENWERGQQGFLCNGLEILLHRQQITSAWFRTTAGLWGERQTHRGLVFNDPNHGPDTGNKSGEVGPKGVAMFADDLATADTWSTRDIIDYLSKYHLPINNHDRNVIDITLDAGARDRLPNWDSPRVATHGRTLKQILDTLLDRRRLWSYTLDVTAKAGGAVADTITLRPFSFNQADVELPSENTLKANPEQRTIDWDGNSTVLSARLTESETVRYQQVRAVGRPVICCGTISAIDLTLVEDWEAAAETDYDGAAKWAMGAAAWAALTRDQQDQAQRDYRKADRLARVYRYFSLPSGWDELVKDGEGGAGNYLFPYARLGLILPWVGTNAAFYLPDLRLRRDLPLKSDHDYTADVSAPVDNTPAGGKWEWLRPIVLIKLQEDLARTVGKYAHCEHLEAAADVEGAGDGHGRTFGVSVRTQADGPGLVLTVNGKPQHAIATARFMSHDPIDDIPLGRLDYQDNLIATVAMDADYRVEALWPAAAEQADAVKVLTIECGERAQLHYIAPGTVVGIDDGDLERVTAGGFARDDREWLKDIARAAWEWYGAERRALQLSLGTVHDLHVFGIGDLITTADAAGDDHTVNTVLTSVVAELIPETESNPPPPPSVTIKTQFVDFDPLALV